MKVMKIEQPKSLASMVAARLRSAIIDGELGLGESIAEEKLAESFGVSRTPVRDALLQLQVQGLVEIQPKRGSFVFTPTATDVVRLCEFRLMLELQALNLAIQRNQASLLRELDRIVALMTEARAQQDAVAYGQLDTIFHQVFVDHADNSYLADAYQLVAGQVAALRTHLTRPIAQLREQSYDEHCTLTDMARREDFEGLNALMTQHISRTGDLYLAALQERTQNAR